MIRLYCLLSREGGIFSCHYLHRGCYWGGGGGGWEGKRSLYIFILGSFSAVYCEATFFSIKFLYGKRLNGKLTFRPARPWPPRGRWPRPGSSPSSGRSAHAQTRSLPGTSYPEHSCIYRGIIPQFPYHEFSGDKNGKNVNVFHRS